MMYGVNLKTNVSYDILNGILSTEEKNNRAGEGNNEPTLR